MRIRSTITTIALATGLAVAGIAVPARAALTGATTTTFTITGGALAITMPESKVFDAVATGAATAGGLLGDVTVADSRGVAVNGWVSTVSTTTFLSPTPGVNGTVAVVNVGYASGPFTAHSGEGTFVAGTSFAAPPTYTAGQGNSSTTWNPTLTLTLLSSQVAGLYTGTITHSVA
jgi:hypothetical protein